MQTNNDFNVLEQIQKLVVAYMNLIDLYNPLKHVGELPVRVLSLNFQDCFENITPDFKEEFKSEIQFNGLNRAIKYHVIQNRITQCALINISKQIELFENFNQFLWCNCYSLLVLFDESIRKPMLNGTYTGQFDISNSFVKDAIQVFSNGFDLLHKYKDWQFFQIPNPEKYSEANKYYIERANGVFTTSMTFILLHEFAHQYYGHLDFVSNGKESKKEEFDADDYAIDKMAFNFSSLMGDTYKVGIVVGLCSLILLSNSLDGGEHHPDNDDRLKSAMEKLELDELHYLWGIASLAIRLWAIKYNVKLELPQVVENYKELFELIYSSISSTKNKF